MGQKIATSIIKKAMQKVQERGLSSITLLEATLQKDLAYEEYGKAKKDAEMWRDDFLSLLAKQRSDKKTQNSKLN